MITIGFSSKKVDENFVNYIKKSIGIPNVEIIPIENPGKYSLTEAYNIILKKATNDIIVFCHDDIYFDKNNWGNKILKHFKRNPEYGILGVAGSTKLPKSGMWWEDRTRMRGIVNHEHEGRKWESKYSKNLGNKIDDVVLVDGLFFAVNKKNVVKDFDESVKGFHLYDVDFCFRNYIENVHIGVIYDIRITHKSIGQTNQQWEDNRIIFSEKYESKLPVKITPNIDINTNLKVLLSSLFFKNYTGSEMYVYELAKELTKLNCDVTVLSDIDGPLSQQAKQYNIKTIPFSEPPGYKMGDGQWGLNTPNGFQPTQPNMLYKVSEVDYDIIHVQHKPVTERILQLYPTIPKIATIHSEVIDLEDPVNDDTILKYITIRPEIKDKITTVDGIPKDKVDIIYNPVDDKKFNTINTSDEGYILFVGTIDYLRETTIRDISNYAKDNNRELWIVGENKSDYLNELLSESHVKHFKPTTDVQKYVKNSHETAGILLGRTTIESWLCGKNSWIYNVDSSGIILSKELTTPPNDIDKFKSSEVARKIKENYIKIIKQW